jgi:valyl-tRNA synthetase
MVKPYLYQEENKKRKVVTQQTLLRVLDATLRLLHPFMPYVTEEIWQQLPSKKETDSIMIASYPRADGRYDDDRVADEMDLLIEVITALRNIRGEMDVPPGEQIDVIIRTKVREVEERIERNQLFVRNLARVKSLMIGEEIERPAHSAFAVVQNAEIFVPMDRSRMEEEGRRLQKEISKVEKEIQFVEKKLSNEQFMAKAPAEVVQEEKEKALQYRDRRDRLDERLKKIQEALK